LALGAKRGGEGRIGTSLPGLASRGPKDRPARVVGRSGRAGYSSSSSLPHAPTLPQMAIISVPSRSSATILLP
jgi:hypothetical protein